MQDKKNTTHTTYNTKYVFNLIPEATKYHSHCWKRKNLYFRFLIKIKSPVTMIVAPTTTRAIGPTDPNAEAACECSPLDFLDLELSALRTVVESLCESLNVGALDLTSLIISGERDAGFLYDNCNPG